MVIVVCGTAGGVEALMMTDGVEDPAAEVGVRAVAEEMVLEECGGEDVENDAGLEIGVDEARDVVETTFQALGGNVKERGLTDLRRLMLKTLKSLHWRWGKLLYCLSLLIRACWESL